MVHVIEFKAQTSEKYIEMPDDDMVLEKYAEEYERLAEIKSAQSMNITWKKGFDFVAAIQQSVQVADVNQCQGTFVITKENTIIPYGTPMFLGIVIACMVCLKIDFVE